MKQHFIRYFLCLFIGSFLVAILACRVAAHPLRRLSVTDSLGQGIEGTVYRTGGNQMPDPHHPAGPRTTVRPTVFVYSLTNRNQAVHEGSSPYYSSISTLLIKEVETDDKGYFRVELAPGFYSLFTKKDGLYYASRMDDKNNIAPVEVLPGKMTPVECRVESDHKAFY